MHKKSFTVCGLTCVAGIFGAFVRWLQNTSAFEQATGLSVPGSAWNTVMAVYLFACAVAFFFATRYLVDRKKMTTGTEYPSAFSGGPAIRGVVAIASTMLMGLGAVLTLSGLSGTRSLFDIINGMSVVVAAICVFYILRNIGSGKKKGGGAAFIFLVLTLCYRLIAEYKVSAPDPVVWHYAIRVLAVSALILAYYYLCGFCFEAAKPKRTIYFCMLAVFLSIVTFADDVSLPYHLITLGLVLALVTLMLLLVGNMVPLKPKAESEAEVGPETEAEPE